MNAKVIIGIGLVVFIRLVPSTSIPKCQFGTLEPPCWHFGISPKYQFDTLEAKN